MSVSRFGNNSNESTSSLDKKYADQKFMTLSTNIALKVDKSGDTLSGNLNVGGNKITNLAGPISDNDATNKTFVDSIVKQESIITKLYVDTLLTTKLDKNITENLNMNGQQIMGLKNPKSDDEACNKKYVDSKIKDENADELINNAYFDPANTLNIQKDDDTTAKKLFELGIVIRDFLKNHKIDEEHFFKSFNYFEKMDEKFMEIFNVDPHESDIISDVVKTSIFYSNLKLLIIKVIEDVPKNVFIELKAELMKQLLVTTPTEKSLRKKCRRFLNGLTKIVDPNRSNEDLELLVQKNLLLIDLGFVYFIESLLKRLLDEA